MIDRSPIFLACGLALGLSLASAQQTPFQINGQLTVCGLKLCNQYGNPIQLRGISTHGIQYYPWGECLKEESITSIAKDWKADILRASMYIQEGGWATNPSKFSPMVDNIVNAATKEGMYVIIDFHQLSPGNPMSNLENAKKYFEEMVPKHGPKGNILYEICNEPSGVKWEVIKEYADAIIPIIRKHDKTSPILVGTMAWASLGVSGQGPWTEILKDPLTDPNSMYVLHFYAKSHKDMYRDAAEAAGAKLPLFVTEFGTQEATGDGPNDFVSSQLWLDWMAKEKISWVTWNFSDDNRTGAVLKTGTCPGGPWSGESVLKEAGKWIFERMSSPDNFPVTPGNGISIARKAAPLLAGKVSLSEAQGAWNLAVVSAGDYSLSLADASGRSIKAWQGNGEATFALRRGEFTPGVHFLRFRHGGESFSRRVVLK